MADSPNVIEKDGKYWQVVTLVDENGDPTGGGGGGGDASSANQSLQITEAESTNTKLDTAIIALNTLSTEAKLEQVRVLLSSLDGKDYSTQTTLASLLTELEKKADLTETQPVSITDVSTETKQDDIITALGTLGTEAKLETIRVLLNSLDGKDYATETKQNNILTSLGNLLTELQLKADLTETQPVSVVGSPSLPADASTETKQDDNITKLSEIKTVNETIRDYSYADLARRIQLGLVSGARIMKAFGEKDNFQTVINGEDVWRGNELTPSGGVQIPIPPDAGDLISVVSENNNDDNGDTGVNEVEIHYITPAGAEASTTVTMNGTTAVNTGILMRFVQYVHTTSVGSNGVAEGNIKVYKTGSPSTVYNMIQEGGNMSMTTNRMIPAGKTLYLQSWDCSEAGGKRLTYRIRSTDSEGVIFPRVFLFKDVSYLNKNASPEYVLKSEHPEFSIVKVSAWGIQAGAEGHASWWGLLIDN